MVTQESFASKVQAALSIELTPVQNEQFAAYRALLLSWNQQLNLTAVRTPDGIDSTHFLDSLSCTLVTGSLADRTLIDIGTGAGFPGLPLKIVFPSLRLTLLESAQKKARFLKTVVGELGLSDVWVVAQRAEEAGHDPAYRERYDWVIARAVADLRVLLEYMSPFCRVNGRILAMKGPAAFDEIESAAHALKELQTEVAALQEVPNDVSGEKSRYLLVLKKTGTLTDRYPRRAGVPGKRPLG